MRPPVLVSDVHRELPCQQAVAAGSGEPAVAPNDIPNPPTADEEKVAPAVVLHVEDSPAPSPLLAQLLEGLSALTVQSAAAAVEAASFRERYEACKVLVRDGPIDEG